jgi:predicted nucleic acid-binding protein
MGPVTKVLLDTDVILDVLLARKDFCEPAARVLSKCEKGEIVGHITPVIFANLFYFVEKNAGTQAAVSRSLVLLDFLEVIPISKSSIISAMLSNQKDKEDALQCEAAYASGFISSIITRNTKDYKQAKIPAYTPLDFLELQA